MSDYRKHPAINQSFLKGVVKNNFTSPSPGIGSIVDSLVYSTGEKFHVGEKIPEAYLFAILGGGLKTIRELGYHKSLTDKTHLEKLEKHRKTFLEANGLPIVTQEDWETANEIVGRMYSDPVWNRKKGGVYQEVLFGQIDGTPIKGMLDQREGKVIRDLKITESKLSEWQYVAKTLMYPFQASFYNELCKQNGFIEFGEENFEWLVWSIPEKRMACFHASKDDLRIGEWGNKYVKGWRQALKIYERCKDEQDYFLDFYEGNGELNTNIYGNGTISGERVYEGAQLDS